jgi:O-glycosyl hydrolase
MRLSRVFRRVRKAKRAGLGSPLSVEPLEDRTLPSLSLTVDGSQQFQRIDGFGANINSAAWGDGDVRPALDTLLNQMGANTFRVIVEAGSGWEDSDPNTGQYSDANPNWPYYDQVYSSPKFTNLWNTIGYLNAHNATVLLNVQGGPPDWMCNQDRTVPAEHEDDWVTMVTTMLSYGVNTAHVHIDQFGPMNEPDNYIDPIQGPQVPPAQYVDMMDRLLASMQALGLGGIQLVGPDCANIVSATDDYMPAMFNDPTLMADVYHFGIHNYSGTSGTTDGTVSGSGWPGRDWWADEYATYYPGVNMDQGQPLPDDDEWSYAETCFQDLLALIEQGASGAMVWDGVDSYYQLENSWSTWGQLSYDQSTQTYAPRLRLYANGMVDKFVTPGSFRVAVTDDADGLIELAFYNPTTGHIAVVGENTGDSALSLNGGLIGGLLTQSFEEYFTNADLQMQRQADVPVTGGAFTFQVPPHTIFTLSSPSGPDTPPPTAPADLGAGDAASVSLSRGASSDKVGPFAGNVLADVLPLGVRRAHLVPEAPAVLPPPDLAAEAPPVGALGAPGPWPGGTFLAPFSLSSSAGTQTAPEGPELFQTGAPVGPGFARALADIPVTGPSSAPAGPGDKLPGTAGPVTARPPDPFWRGALSSGAPPLLGPRAGAAARSGLDLLFAELGRPLGGPFCPDWWLQRPA